MLDLRGYAGSYGFDVASTAWNLAAPEDEAAWRTLAQAHQSAGYPCNQAGLSIRVNQPSFAVSDILVATATLFPPPNVGPLVDAYVVLQLPTGQFLSLQEGGGVVPGIVPFAKNVAPLAFEKVVLQYAFNGSEPPGVYTWHSALTEPGTLALVSPLRMTTFTLP